MAERSAADCVIENLYVCVASERRLTTYIQLYPVRNCELRRSTE